MTHPKRITRTRKESHTPKEKIETCTKTRPKTQNTQKQKHMQKALTRTHKKDTSMNLHTKKKTDT